MKHILFDFDGTIADSEKTALEIMTTLADRHGFPRVSMEDVERLRRMTIAERFRELELPLRRLPGWAKEYNVLFQEAVLKVDPFPGMKDVLRALHEGGYAISILSSNAENNIRRFLDRHGLQFIEDVRCSHRVFSKDRMIKRLLRRYRLQHEDVVYVGTSIAMSWPASGPGACHLGEMGIRRGRGGEGRKPGFYRGNAGRHSALCAGTAVGARPVTFRTATGAGSVDATTHGDKHTGCVT